MPHQTKPGDSDSYVYGHTIGEYPEVIERIIPESKKFLSSVDPIIVNTNDAEKFVKDNNNQNSNKKTLGTSNTDIKTFDKSLGALAPFLNQASGIMNQMYGATGEEVTQKDKDINMGRIALKFFTQMGASASQPGQTALGAANIAGASVAQDYLNKVQSDKDKEAKLEQAKKTGGLSLAMQLKSAKEAKDIAELKAKNVKPSKPDQYKILNVSEVGKVVTLPTTNPMTGKSYIEGDIIELTPNEFNKVPRGNLISFKESTPPKPNTYERLRDGIITNAQSFFNLGEGESLASGLTTKLISDITELRDTKLVPIPDPKDPNKTVMTLQQGVNMYDILEKEFGKDAVDKLKNLAGIETADTFIVPEGKEQNGVGENKGKKFETLNIGGTKFTILSTKDSKLGATEVKTLTNARTGLKRLNTALSLLFKDGKYNRKLVATMNLTPDWALGSIEFLSPGGVSGNALTVIEAMKEAIELILRERSGAAVPPAELENYLKLYLPATYNNEVQARNKIDSLLSYFKGSIDGINQGRQKGGANEDENFVASKLPMKILDKTTKDGGSVMGRRLKKQGSVMYIETEKGSNQFIPLVTKSNN